eukprot:scaffold11899_cov133-Isochrysis_galbana.AAC.2
MCAHGGWLWGVRAQVWCAGEHVAENCGAGLRLGSVRATRGRAELRALVVEMSRAPQQHGERGAARVGVSQPAHGEGAAHVPDVGELGWHRLVRLGLTLGRQRRLHRGGVDRLHLSNEAPVHAEDVVGVVTAKPEQLEDVGDGHGCRIRVKAECDRAVALHIHLHAHRTELQEGGAGGAVVLGRGRRADCRPSRAGAANGSVQRQGGLGLVQQRRRRAAEDTWILLAFAGRRPVHTVVVVILAVLSSEHSGGQQRQQHTGAHHSSLCWLRATASRWALETSSASTDACLRAHARTSANKRQSCGKTFRYKYFTVNV